MQVIISVPGSFHVPMLGGELEERNYLKMIYSTQPNFGSDTSLISNRKISHIHHPHIVEYITHRFPLLTSLIPVNWNDPSRRLKTMLFDRSVSRRLEATEDGIFIGFAGGCLKSLERANELGLTTVVERSSVHIKTQKDILDEEFGKYNQGECPISEQHICREVREYEIADYIVTPSKFAQDSFLNRGFSRYKVKKVPLGTQIPKFSDGKKAQSKRVNFDEDKIYFIYSGQVSLRKGIQYLLPAWDSLDLTEAELIITSAIQDSARPLVQEYQNRKDIHFLGWVDDLYQWFERADVFVFPSMEDGFALVVIEAMASGLPVIVSENTGAKDCIRESVDGITVPAGKIESLAVAIQYMYDNPDERCQMGRNARKQIQSKYTAEDYGSRISSVYRNMI